MQAPFWKADGEARVLLQKDFLSVVEASAAVGVTMLVVPLVDNGRLDNDEQEDCLISFLLDNSETLENLRMRIVFESDFSPPELHRFIGRLDNELFGVNYDVGNSAALGFNAEEEIAAYGNRIMNVHVKDRLLGDTTVPLGEGDANFDAVFGALGKIGYQGNYILQTARAADGDDAGVLRHYRDLTSSWIKQYGA